MNVDTAMEQAELFQTVTRRSPLRYPGGKSRAVKVLDTLIPTTPITTVLAPFVGGGSYELHLTGKDITVTAYDGFQPLVNFWQHLLATPNALAKAANRLRPMDADGFAASRKHLATHPNGTSITDAAMYLAVNRCSFSGSTLSGGFSGEASAKRFNDALIERVRNFWNPNITVQHADFEDSIVPGYDLIFADPPYLLPEESNKLYGSRGNMHDTFDHVAFHDIITSISSPWLITYNDSPELRALYADYDIQSVSWSYGMNATKASSEIVIRNYS